jgi:hypothetical protein
MYGCRLPRRAIELAVAGIIATFVALAIERMSPTAGKYQAEVRAVAGPIANKPLEPPSRVLREVLRR